MTGPGGIDDEIVQAFLSGEVVDDLDLRSVDGIEHHPRPNGHVIKDYISLEVI